jgi:GNAT superfamily N-acetyltransferase
MNSPAVVLRPGQAWDAPLLRELTWRLTVTNPAYREQALARPEAIEGPDRALAEDGVIVATVDGRVVGYVAVVTDGRGEAEVDGLFVDPEFQRRGVGRRLLDAGAGVARGRGASRLTVVSAPDVVEVYENFGFRSLGPTATLFGPAVMMRMPLSPPAGADSRRS